MITYLRMVNFRRHRDTELSFEPDDHLLLISGKNGVGKSTIIEAMTFALYGEGRWGRRRLEQLITRGEELEGMEVELRFVVEGAEYQVRRRRDGRTATAVLYGNGEPLVESTAAVTSEITRIMGMDAAGFRLAVLAQQKELDGLAALTPAVRKRMVGRLLRLDVVAKAKQLARDNYRTLREVVDSLTIDHDLDVLNETVKTARTTWEANTRALTESEQVVAELVVQLEQLAETEQEWQTQTQAYHESAGRVDNAELAQSRATQNLDALGVPPVVRDAPATITMIREAQIVVEQQLAIRLSNKHRTEQAAALRAERKKDSQRLLELETELKHLPGTVEVEVGELTVADAAGQVASVEKLVGGLTEQINLLKGELQGFERRLSKVQALGDECSQCGQAISEKHQHQIKQDLETEVAKQQHAIVELAEQHTKTVLILDTKRSSYTAAAQQLVSLQQQFEASKRHHGEIANLQRRLGVYQQTDEVEVFDQADIDGLQLWREALDTGLTLATQAEEDLRMLESYRGNLKRLRKEKRVADAAYAEAVKVRDALAPSTELLASIAELAKVREGLEKEKELCNQLKVEVAVAKGSYDVAESALSQATLIQQKRDSKARQAQVAEQIANVLGALSDKLVADVRPALEVVVSDVLGRLSDDRFNDIEITTDYDIMVRDDGELRSLGELSGGERDLVALAMRLGLAALVSERHGAGGPGFLILDECFGSQDVERRNSILDALRNLRSTYGQIYLISHVQGIEDACDRVIEVRLQEEDDDLGMRKQAHLLEM